MVRRNAARALVAVGTLLALLAILSVWFSRQVLETDQWTKTSSKLLADPAVQTVLSGYLVDQLYANVDVAAQLQSALPPRAQALAGPAAAALRQGADQVARQALQRPRVQLAWEQANRTAHQQLVRVIDGGGSSVSTNGGVVTLNLKTMLTEIAGRTGVGSKAVAKIPDSAASITILRSNQLRAAQTAARVLKPLAALIVVLMLVCFGAAIWLAADRRREILRACGWGLMFAGALALVVRSIGRGTITDQLGTTEAVKPAISATWNIGTSLLVGVAVATIAYGALIVFGAWLAGPTTLAVRLRRAIAPYLDDLRIVYGVVAAVILLVLLWGPTEATRRALPAIALIVLLLIGVEVFRRRTVAEFPDAERGSGGWSLDGARGAARRTGARLGGMRRSDGAINGATTTDAGDGDDAAISRLERLTALHDAGTLDDEEFAAAKRRVLDDDATTTPAAAVAGGSHQPEGGTP
jgi:putative oligomerization/nucleic acid binding protein